MMKLFKNEDAFTGLEAAIVLIAFVVVAAVFSYVMLGAGFFTAQESQRVVHTGSQQASSSLEIIGNVYGYANDGADHIYAIEFAVGNTAGGSPIDIGQMLVTYVCENESRVIQYDPVRSIVNSSDSGTGVIGDGLWGVNETYNDVGGSRNHLLQSGEQFVLQIKVPSPAVNKQFALNLQPAVGAVYPIKRTVPPNLDLVNILN